MFKAHCVTVRDPFHPMRNREINVLDTPTKIGALAPQTSQPFIILRNGEAVLRADWHQPVADGDLLAVVLLPQGGDEGGSDVTRIILTIIVIVISYYFPPAAGLTGWQAAAATAAINIAGQVLINAILPPPRAAGGSGDIADMRSASPTYNLSAQGNQARLESAIPIQYGRMQVFPDFAAAPYVEYAGNEQYLYQLFCIGAGEFELESVKIEDTAIEHFEEVEYQVVAPGEQLTLFPSAVATSGEVAGQELLQGNAIGPFTANGTGTLANRLAVDVVATRGLYVALNDGSLSAMSLQFRVDVRPIDDAGSPTGPWATLGTENIVATTTTPQRYSFSYPVVAGRYELKVERLDTKTTSNQAGHELVWAGLRAYLQDESDFGDVTLLAVKIRATNNLSQQSSRKVNGICTRNLYQWTGAAWAGPYATRSIAWALADACKTVGLSDSRIDLDGLVALNATWAARGDTFNGRFDSTTTFWEALTSIARAGRCKPYMQAGIVHFRRDEAAALPVALYSMRNIIKNSFSIEFMTPSDDTADAVQVSYWDQSTWKSRRMTCALPGASAARPAKVELFGVTDRDQAYREGLYMAAANRYRRTVIKFSTEMEGFIPSYGDLVAINHDMPQWGQHAEVVAWSAGARTVTLSEPMTWGVGPHYLAMRRRDGSVSGPYAVTAGASLYQLVLADLPDITPYTGQEEERTHVVFGWADTWAQLARVIAVRPPDQNTVEMTCINEDGNVHSADIGVFTPPVISSQLPATPSAPLISGLQIKSKSGDPSVMLGSWQPAPGAAYYIVEQSVDGGSWVRTAETTANNFTAPALYGPQTLVRVAAVGSLYGSWVQVAYAIESDYMWSSSSGSLMWSSDANLMWRT